MRPGALALAVMAACAGPRAAPEVLPMDELLVAGTLHTMDPERGVVAAALVRGGVFACVGSRPECARMAGPAARVVDLDGGSAVPGLADAHGHVLGLGRAALEVSCAGAGSEAGCAERAAARARELPPGSWVRGRGWDQNLWPGGRFPAEATLSAAVPDHPVVLVRVDGHAVWVNARALLAAGVGRETPDPPGGTIHRRPDGVPSGVLVDTAAELVLRRVPAPSPQERERLILSALAELVRAGLTSVHDAGVDAPTLEVYRALAERDRLPLRVYAMIDGQAPARVLAEQMALWGRTPEVGRLTVRAVKMYADGALGSRGAWLHEPYSDDASTRGLQVTPPQELRRRILAAARAGFQPAVHAIGDRACAEVLAGFAEAGRAVPMAPLRPRVEHLQVLLPDDAHLLGEVGAVASMQPVHAVSDAPWAEARLGRDTARRRGAYAWRRVLSLGVPLAFGSDFPVESHDPRLGLFAAETRRPAGSRHAWMPEERVTREEALRAFTAGAAFAAHAERRRGMIRAGYDADLTAFDRDVMAVPVDELLEAEVVLTLVGGRVEHRRERRGAAR